MSRLSVALVAGSIWIGITPAFAQIDPVVVGQGQVLGAMNQGYADRAAGRVATERSREYISPRSRAYCRNKGEVRDRLGADDPRTVRLYRACARAGL